MIKSQSRAPERLKRAINDLRRNRELEMLIKLLQMGMESSELKKTDPDTLANALLMISDQIMNQKMEEDSAEVIIEETDENIESVCRFILNGFAA